MSNTVRFFLVMAFVLGACDPTLGGSITYVRKAPNVTSFMGWGQAGYYFPQFNSGKTEERPDDGMVMSNPSWLKWNWDPWGSLPTFSVDADWYGGNPPKGKGVYSEGGQNKNWALITLPNGESGFSGAAVDEHARNTSNNSVNRIELRSGVPSSFCMHIVTDNTNGTRDSVSRIEVDVDEDGNEGVADPVGVPSADLFFDTNPDVYTFKFDNFDGDDYIQIKLNGGGTNDPSFGGLMWDTSCAVVPGSTCDNGVCELQNGESCETCPADCGNCAAVRILDWEGGATWPHNHNPDDGTQIHRMLVLTVHSVDDRYHSARQVTFGGTNINMTKAEERTVLGSKWVTTSIWYLREGEIALATSPYDFNVSWSDISSPERAAYKSVLLDNVFQAGSHPFGDTDTNGNSNFYKAECHSATVESSHLSLIAGTSALATPLYAGNGYTEDFEMWMGSRGRGMVGHRFGSFTGGGEISHPGFYAGITIVCLEIRDSMQTDTDGDTIADFQDTDDDNDGVLDGVDNCPTKANGHQLDVDADGVGDACDNCIEMANGPVLPDAGNNVQLDTDGDGYGNICDADYNNNGIVDPFDFSLLKSVLGATTAPNQDLNGNGVVDPSDFSRLKEFFGQPPGPSGLVP